MTISLLFNSGDPKYKSNYGYTIRDLILSSKVLADSHRNMILSFGDVLILSHVKNMDDYIKFSMDTYFANNWNLFKKDILIETIPRSEIFVCVIQNITKKIAIQLNSSLSIDSAYLGLHEIDFTNKYHLVFYRNYMIPKYRIHGELCFIFYREYDEESKDEYEKSAIKELGYKKVEWEDFGLRRTVFDNFDTIEHFQKIKDFKNIIATYLKNIHEDADDIVLLLEDLNPKLFNELGAFSRIYLKAKNIEDYAQAALSLRRYLEQLADCISPPSNDKYKGMDLLERNVKNRLNAFIDKNNQNRSYDYTLLETKIRELYRIINKLIHTKEIIVLKPEIISDITIITTNLLLMSPNTTKDPYLAYSYNLESLHNKMNKNEE